MERSFQNTACMQRPPRTINYARIIKKKMYVYSHDVKIFSKTKKKTKKELRVFTVVCASDLTIVRLRLYTMY
jgi:hypothetical protein